MMKFEIMHFRRVEIFLGDKGRPAPKAENLTAICEPII
jgi:hypothetical protein